MGKTLDYPQASFKSAQEMAGAVDSLGGSCSVEMCAEKMELKVGGGFHYITGAAQKFGLVTHKAGRLQVTPLFREIKLAYNDQERNTLLASSFLSPPVFLRLYERFKGKELPVSMLDKMLIKEYDVDDNSASRIKKYFIDGAKSIGLLDAQNQLLSLGVDAKNELATVVSEELETVSNASPVVTDSHYNVISLSDLDEFVFHITGPGVNSRIAIREEEDFVILEAMIRKIKKRPEFNQ